MPAAGFPVLTQQLLIETDSPDSVIVSVSVGFVWELPKHYFTPALIMICSDTFALLLTNYCTNLHC